MIKEFLPPILVRYLLGFRYGWSGAYITWSQAEKKCTGYDSEEIFNKVKASLLKVKSGEAVFERDSVVFDKVQYSFPLLSALCLTALASKNRLNVIDFGGSLGSTYYQNKNLLKGLDEFSWNIIEQPHFVEEGKKTFSDEILNFYYSMDECLKNQQINIILLGSVLQYIEKPYELLNSIVEKRIPHLVIDRTPIFTNNKDRIMIQKVPKSIYNAQYPSWIFNEKKLIDYFISKDYELVFDSESSEKINVLGASLKGYFFKLKA